MATSSAGCTEAHLMSYHDMVSTLGHAGLLQVKKMAEHDNFVNSCCPLRRGPRSSSAAPMTAPPRCALHSYRRMLRLGCGWGALAGVFKNIARRSSVQPSLHRAHGLPLCILPSTSNVHG